MNCHSFRSCANDISWDANSNGFMSAFEFAKALAARDLVTRFDTDDEKDTLDETEVATGLFLAAAGDGGGAIAIENGGFFADIADMLDKPIDLLEPSLDLIEAGRSFTQLPVPCGRMETVHERPQISAPPSAMGNPLTHSPWEASSTSCAAPMTRRWYSPRLQAGSSVTPHSQPLFPMFQLPCQGVMRNASAPEQTRPAFRDQLERQVPEQA